MKSNKEKIYDFIQMHQTTEEGGGVSTAYIARAMSLQRTNVSSLLNTLVEEGRVQKSNGRPVLYSIICAEARDEEECFCKMTGWNGSLQHAIQLAKAAVLYPGKSLNILIVGEKGTGKKEFAHIVYEYCLSKQIFAEGTPFLQMNCRDYQGSTREAREKLLGERQSGMLKDAESGILYMDNVQYLDGGLLREIAEYSTKSGRKGLLIASCTPDAQPAQEEFQSEFPIIITMPRITERPIEERMEMIQTLFSTEASRVGRELVVKEELMRCLLLYECPENFQQLKRDIKIGCANAYVRELANENKITLYVSDFDSKIRQGMSRFGQVRREIESLIPENSIFTFDGSQVRVSETETKNIYTELRQKAKVLEAEGIEDDDIKMLLSTEVERAFGKYQKKLIHEVRSRKELELIVDEKLIDMVERFLARVESEKNRKIEDSVFFGLCLHMKNVVNGIKAAEAMDRLEISEVVTKYKQEYMLSLSFAEEIQEAYGKQLSVDEVILITMFLCYEPPKQMDQGQIVILYAFYGKDIAASIVRTITEITGMDNIFSFEVSHRQSETQIYDSLKKCILEIEQKQGVFIVYDSDLISKIAGEISDETGIIIRLFPAPVTTMGIELARKSMISPNLDAVYRDTMKSVGDFATSQKKYIITLCTTGKGGAEELKTYIERYGHMENVQIIPLSMSDSKALQETFRDLMRQGTILCVVGTFDPKIYSIPFCSITEVFMTPKERLPELLRRTVSRDYMINYQEVFGYLAGQFSHVDVEKVQTFVEEFLHGIDQKLKHMTQDAQMGLLIHTACCIERLASGENSPENPKKKAILHQYRKEFQQILRMLRPMEKAFHIIFSDDEVANILMIIYQI